ncbi:hypothetical protein IKD60_00585 [Candidatus Saccharibacteria bacterium]|nr:hypothetical protein [Candidatus Saccharibacteria bacterium]
MEKSSTSTNKTSIFTPRKTAGFFFLSLLGNIAIGLIIWPLLDLFWSSVIDKTTFVYSVKEHIVWPAIVMIVLTIIEFVFFDSVYKSKKKK